MFATVAQSVERLTCNEDVAGSIPVGGSNFLEYNVKDLTLYSSVW